MTAYRKRPVVVDAYEFIADSAYLDNMPDWLNDAYEDGRAFTVANGPDCSEMMLVRIPTLEGTMDAWPGDWIIQGVRGELYPCKPDVFALTYEELAPTGQDETLAQPLGRTHDS